MSAASVCGQDAEEINEGRGCRHTPCVNANDPPLVKPIGLAGPLIMVPKKKYRMPVKLKRDALKVR